jgi:large subunit ribosomal protein L13
MVPYKRERGIEAMKRIRIYVGVPDEFSGQPVETIENASRKRLGNPSHVTLGAVSTFLGAKY